jgi:hypothetical protein
MLAPMACATPGDSGGSLSSYISPVAANMSAVGHVFDTPRRPEQQLRFAQESVQLGKDSDFFLRMGPPRTRSIVVDPPATTPNVQGEAGRPPRRCRPINPNDQGGTQHKCD